MRFEPFALRFDEDREAELVSEALYQLRCETAADQVRVTRMRKLIDDELQGGNRG